MTLDTPLGSLLAVHSRFAAAGVVVWIAVLVTGSGTIVSATHGGTHLTYWLGFAGAGLLALMALGIAGYRVLRAMLIADVERREAILSLAHRDALTGAFNRAHFIRKLREHLRHDLQRPLCYMQIDMDNLKVLNDGSGHSTGDAALVHLVRTIEKLTPGAMIGRLGGDEFGVAIIGQDNKAALRRLGDLIIATLGEQVTLGGRAHRLSATIGVAVTPQDGVDADELMSKADLALYKGKRSGRRKTIAFDRDMLADERHRRFIERDLRAAVMLNELELHYQPVFDLDGVISSYESLVRWQHTVRGIMPPSAFIPVAEQSDLIDGVGEWVLRRACLDRVTLGDIPLAVNISPVQLRRPEFAARFEAILAETNAPGRALIVEITETVPLTAGTVETANIEALRKLGVRIAIDDFGAGYASLEYLRKFRFDILKLDRSLVADVATNRVDAMLAGAICRIAKVIDVCVVAEGVETEEQRDALIGLGCTHFQGYLLGGPEPLARPIVLREASAA